MVRVYYTTTMELEEDTLDDGIVVDTAPLTTSNTNGDVDLPPAQEAPLDKIYTVDEAINKLGFGPFQILLSVFCGLLWLADAMEFMLLSILSPAVKCQWDLSGPEEAAITSVVFAGSLLGGLFWGVICDIIGRRNGLFAMILIILICGVLSALQVSSGDTKFPGYPWLLICRFGVGFGSGGTGLVTTFYIEFLPMRARGTCSVLVAVWWALGTMLGALVALGVFGGGLSWHWFLGLVAIPEAAVLFMFALIPESARFYLAKGKNDKAQNVIKRVAWYNFKEVPPGRIVSHEYKEKLARSRSIVVYSQGTVTIQDEPTSYDVTADESNDDVSDIANSENDEHPLLESDDVPNSLAPSTVRRPMSILSKIYSMNWLLVVTDGMWKTTLILVPMWVGVSWLYYGGILLTTTLLRYDPHCGAEMLNSSNLSNISCEDSELDTSDYLKILWTTAAELPGLFLTVVTIEVFGRKITLALDFIISMIGFLLLFICTSDVVLTSFLFIIRAFTNGAFQALYVYSPEVYPTDARAFAMGILMSVSRIGGIVTPYVAQVLLDVNDYATLSLYAGSSLALAVLAMLLPIETKGRLLKQK